MLSTGGMILVEGNGFQWVANPMGRGPLLGSVPAQRCRTKRSVADQFPMGWFIVVITNTRALPKLTVWILEV